MKIAIGYPPLESNKGVPLLSQNRQFQWFHHPTFIYPMVPAYAATLLKKAGHEVVWLDGIAEKWRQAKWLDQVKKEKPDLMVLETKTPVVKKHWQIIKKLQPLKTVLVGDHVTALPKESFENSPVDYVLTGGDYDFLLLNLVNHLTKKTKLEPGIWLRQGKKIKSTGQFLLNHDLNKLPFIDRELTHWQLYAYENGNYKRTPGTYIMAGRDCWWRKNGGCQFCAWTVLYPQWRARKPKQVLDEIGKLLAQYPIKEIMDDTGTFPAGEWLREFCQGMRKRGYHRKINFDCNLRFGSLTKKDYQLMAKAGFRFLLYGLESANQKTVDHLNKGIKVSQIEKELKMVKEASKEVKGHLEPHVTCMVGYPWETKKEAEKTIEMTKQLFSQGLIDTLQATIVIPYPGTKLFQEAAKKGWLKTKDWEKYDMSQPVMKTPMKDSEVLALTRGIYQSFATPQFVTRKALSVRNFDDLKFFWRAGKAVWGHLTDFHQK
jgi:anaerobic magnesium-protoporphyrin IX monomethyl ester cyclase